MATSAPLRSLEEEVTCSICLDYLRDPVTIDCGHVFCRSCTTDVRPVAGGRPVCPLCKKPFKKENIRPVWQLASLVENIERLKVDKGRQPGEGAREQQDAKLCERHQEKLHYYCEDDGKLLCVICRESREHRPHTAVLMEKAAQPHREKILNHLTTLRRDRDKIQSFQTKGDSDILAALQKLQDQKQCIVALFEKSHEFLREREQHLLDQLAKLEQELTEGREKYKARGVGELARLALVISELEGKAQQPAAELMQDTRDFLNRYPRKKFWIGKPIARVVKKRTGEFSDKLLSLQRGLREFQGKLLRDLEYKTVSVTLDPQSASGYLLLSEDWKCVTYSNLYRSNYLYPQQFDCEPGVLGSKGFTWGKVYWEVEVEREGWSEEEEEGAEEEEGEEEEEEEEAGYGDGYDEWETTDEDEESLGDEEEEEEEEEEVLESCMVGVARDSMKRKGDLSLRPEDGVWALRLSSAGIWANTDPEAELFPALRPRRVGIALDYEGGTVTFTNAESQELIYTFTATFTRRLVPFLWLKWPGTRLLLRP
ncbi:tripartite motif-containing protein 26 isoform X1 [Loxodonta africana]|uniref:tripartite motif-containing protein 26 isoform X1 n=1 Tax=Loxodonta africana TaxID=9785 RepID=UPI00022363CE|nr:tripartite motif-containing protein 26 isoform X1 [Loxodonta africana]XP_010599490.1 tripartite motif-containing protein 26 isoform X1 [Loxodonta africana]XP_049734424.1 tripartite motif-containing protein 26 isoform X1 [Elephas maximus indicus]XP_049734522.1 tripartite motif-containing protein 26 isoform X1 [Elephas maximus indicus]